MKSMPVSRILAVLFGFNVFQFLMILLKPGEAISWAFVFLTTIPLLFVSYNAMKLNKVSYLLLLYWFAVQIFSFDFGDAWKLSLSYGFIFRLTFFNESVAINPIVLLLAILALLEVDKVFPEQDDSRSLTSGQAKELLSESQLLHEPEQKEGNGLTSASS